MNVQKNVLLHLVEEDGLRAADFDMDDQGGTTYVRHLPSGSAFSIGSEDGVSFYGGAKVGDAGWYPYEPAEWQLLLVDEFTPWIRRVKLEVETPDNWEVLRRANAFIGKLSQAHLDNTPFTLAEQSQIADSLHEIKAYLTESRSLTEAQAESIKAKIDHAEEASRRLGRKDWAGILLGALVSVVLSVVLPADVLQHVFFIAARDLGHLLGPGGSRQLPPHR